MSAKTTAGQDEDEDTNSPSKRDTTPKSSCRRASNNDVPSTQSEEDIQTLLSQLRLPRIHPSNNENHPSLRILVVANIDLTSAAALAEHALQPNARDEIGGGNVDVIIACGPFCNDEQVRSRYLTGRNRNNTRRRQAYERSREETAALEGLVSATLAQLESIACRIAYVPHPSDPSTLMNEQKHLRLTPNSINIHSHWLSLAPGIGCCGYAGISLLQRLQLHGAERVRVQHGCVYVCAY